MAKRTITGLVAGFMVVSAASQLLPMNYVDAAPAANVKIPTLKTVNFGKKSYFKINSISLMPSSGASTGKTLYFTVTVHNGENNDLSFLDYWVKVRTTSGGVVKSKMLGDEKVNNFIPAGGDTVYNFYATVTSNTAIESLKFTFFKFDGSSANYERALGTITVPKGYTSTVELNKSGTVTVEGEPMRLSVLKLSKQEALDYSYFTLQLKAQNSGRKTLGLPAYKYYIRTSNNLLYPLYPDKNSTKPIIDAQDQATLEMSAKVSSKVNLNNAELVIALNDDTAKLEMPLASFRLPTSTLETVEQTPFQQPYDLEINRVPVSLKVTRASVDNGLQKKIKIMVQWTNNGNESIELPTYAYMLKTSDNVLIPLTRETAAPTAEQPAAISINPRWSQDIALATPVAEQLDLTGASLILYKTLSYGSGTGENATTTDVKVPAAKFTLPPLQGMSGYVSPGTEIKYETGTSTYNVVVDHVNRLPWADDDEITATIKLTNKGKATAGIPELVGTVTVDGYSIKAEQIRIIKDSQAVNIEPDAAASYHLIAKIPYVQKVKQISFDIQAKEKDVTTDVAHVAETMANIQAMTPITTADWPIEQAGKSFGAKLVSKKLYTGTNNQVAQVQLELENKTQRYSTPPVLTGWLVTKDGYYFRLSAGKLDTAVSPTGKAFITLQGVVPKNVSLTDAQFVVGQAVTAAGWSTDPTASDGVVKADSLALNTVTGGTIQSSFASLAVMPYTLSIDKINFGILSFSTQMDLKFHSVLSLSAASYEASSQSPKLYFELAGFGYVFGKEVPLEQGEGIGLGEMNKTVSIAGDFSQAIINSQETTINIYEVLEVNGQTYKNRIATRSAKWFLEN